MKNKRQKLKVVPAKEFRNALFAGRKFKETARSTESLLSILQDTSLRNQVDKLGIRYAIIVGTNTSTFGEHWEFDLGDELGTWGYTKSWVRSSQFLGRHHRCATAKKSREDFLELQWKGRVCHPSCSCHPTPPDPVLRSNRKQSMLRFGG